MNKAISIQTIPSITTVLVIFLLLIGLNACSPDAKHNIILITLDTQRADHISAYSRQFAQTPNIDSLAEKGILFEKCYSPTPITLPAHASLFYSQLPSQLQIYNNGDVFNGEGKESLAEIFQKRGYSTHAIVSLGVLKEKFGLYRGFDTYDDIFPREKWYLDAAEVNQKAHQWLEANRLSDFFLWIHYSDPHGPYSPPGEPPDLKIFVNDEFQKDLCLDKNRTEELDVALHKGKNTLRLEVMNPFNDDPTKSKARLDVLELIPPSEKDIPRIEFGRGAAKRDHRGTTNIYLGKEAHLNIFSDTEQPSIKLKLRGRLLLKPKGCQVMYRKEVEYMDREIGKLFARLESLSLLDNTAILIVGDHGEGLGEYRFPGGAPHIGHIHFLYSLYLDVPFIVYSPRIIAGGLRIKEPVSIMDVGPTILGLLGWKQPDFMVGTDVFKGEKQKRETSPLFGETYEPQSFYTSFCLIQYPWHLIITPKKKWFELYDLSKDPLERQNIYSDTEARNEMAQLEIKLNDYIRTSIAKKLPDKEKDEDTLEMLRSLGYIK